MNYRHRHLRSVGMERSSSGRPDWVNDATGRSTWNPSVTSTQKLRRKSVVIVADGFVSVQDRRWHRDGRWQDTGRQWTCNRHPTLKRGQVGRRRLMLVQRGRCLHGWVDENIVSRRGGTRRGGVNGPRGAVVGRGRVHQDRLSNGRKCIRRICNWLEF